MFFNYYNFSKNKEVQILTMLFLFSFLIRIPVVIFYGDTNLEYEWKTLVDNLVEYKQLAWKDCEFSYSTTKVCLDEGFLLPNLWMPPLYVYYLYLFKFIGLQDQNYILLILSTQILLASLSVVVFYEINKIFFSKKLSLFSSIIFSIFPLHVYASSQISSISLQTFLTILFIYLFFRILNYKKFSSILYFAFCAGLLILLRGEFYVILFLTLVYLFFLKLEIKKILMVVIITSITISPYLIRNVLIFDKFTMMKSFGYNLWKGNHPHAMENSLVVGSEIVSEDFQKKRELVPRDKFLRFNLDKIFFEEAVKNFKDEPAGHIVLVLKKAASFLLIDFNSPASDYYNPLHYLPVLAVGITSLIGVGASYKKTRKFNYFILILFAYVFIFSTVSILPRYKLIILPMQLIFTNILLESFKRFKK